MKEDNLFSYIEKNYKVIIGFGTIIVTVGISVINFVSYLCHVLYFQKWNIPLSFLYMGVENKSLFYLISISFLFLIIMPLLLTVWSNRLNSLLLLLLNNKIIRYRANYIKNNYYNLDKNDSIELDTIIQENRILAIAIIRTITIYSVLYIVVFSISYIVLSITEGNDVLQSFYYSILIGTCQLAMYTFVMTFGLRKKIKLLRIFKKACTKGDSLEFVKAMYGKMKNEFCLPIISTEKIIEEKIKNFGRSSLIHYGFLIVIMSVFIVISSAIPIPKRFWVYKKGNEAFAMVFQGDGKAILKKAKISDEKIIIYLNNQLLQDLNDVDLQFMEFGEIRLK